MTNIKKLIESDSPTENIVGALLEVSPKWSPGNLEGNWAVLDNAFSHVTDRDEKSSLINKVISTFDLELIHKDSFTREYGDDGENVFMSFEGDFGMVGVNLDGKYSKRDIERVLGI